MLISLEMGGTPTRHEFTRFTVYETRDERKHGYHEVKRTSFRMATSHFRKFKEEVP